MTATPRKYVTKTGATKWHLQYRLTPGGKPTTETFSTLDGALKFARLVDQVGGAEARRIREATTTSYFTTTMRDAFEEYCDHAASHVEPRTVEDYRRIWKRYLTEFDLMPIEGMTRRRVEQWVTSLRSRETALSISSRRKDPQAEPVFLSPKTIRNAHGLLSSVLALQVERHVIGVNPAYGVAMPRQRRRRQPVFLTVGQLKKLIECTREDCRLLVRFLAGTGLRWSEATQLQPRDIDFSSRPAVIHVSRAWKKQGTGFVVGAPKSPASVRDVSMPDSLSRDVREACAGKRPDDLVFPSSEGLRMRDSWFHQRIWQPAVTRAGLDPRPRVHDLRHTHASMLIAAGVPLPYIQRRLGHENISTTVDTYGHLAPDAGRVAAAATETMMAELDEQRA